MVVANVMAQAPVSSAQNIEKKKNFDSDAAQIVTSDITFFWKAYDVAKPENNLIVFRDQYLRKGSPGLKEFTRRRIGSSCGLVDAIEQHPKYYASLRDTSLQLDSYKDALRASFRKLKEIYDAAVFPDIYFLMGRMNSAGTLTDEALLIGIDMFGRTKNAPLDELDQWHKANIKPIEAIPFVVAHELIHYQQKYPNEHVTLLQQAVNEGSADFIAQVIAGGHGNEHIHVYGNLHERELWLDFKKEMMGTDSSNWLYQGDKATNRPADLGYYIGYKICEAYYKNAADKKKAIKDILEIKDFEQFLKASKYEEKFKN
jgi:hypothetical protein